MSRLLAVVAVFILLMSVVEGRPADAKAPGNKTWEPYDRPAQYGIVEEKDLKIVMRDGVVLYANITRPDAPGKFPVILTQTPYNKEVLGGANTYLVARGYAHVVVDVRGTGNSEGTWGGSAKEAEIRDGYEIVEWAASQPWSDGKVGLYGTSYMALNQFYTAGQQQPSLKAMFAIVPMADSYRDLTRVGGQSSLAFIPGWLLLTLTLSLLPPSYYAEDPQSALLTYMQHTGNILATHIPGLAERFAGGDASYDGPGYRLTSPIEYVDRVNVPVFVVGGLRDIFMRGEPLLYEALKARKVNTKLLMGDWTHTQVGAGLPADGVPTLNQIALRWFDHYLKGINTQVDKIPDVTQMVRGEGRYEVQPAWPHPDIKPRRLYLRSGGRLSTVAPSVLEPSDLILQTPVSGTCSGTTNQQLLTGVPHCANSNNLAELTEITFDTPVFEQAVRFSGPIAANIWITTTAQDAVLSVRVTDVAPDGRSTELSFGLLTASMRAVDSGRSRFIGGENMQPWHPFTLNSKLPVNAGEPMLLQVEIFPTNAVIQPGHKLRVSVGPSNFPSWISPLPELIAQTGGIINILHSPAHPSYLALPVIQPATWPPKW